MDKQGFEYIRSILKQPELLEFMKHYLNRRYSEHSSITKSFTNEMLESLIINGINPTKMSFFKPLVRHEFDILYDKIKPNRFKFDMSIFWSFLKNIKPNASLLDFGTGNGDFLLSFMDFITERNIKTYASDLFPDLHDKKNQAGINFIKQTKPYELSCDLKFDVILLRRVAHHVVEIQRLIGNLTENLNSGGLLILIEDTFDNEDFSVCEEVSQMYDYDLTAQFNSNLDYANKLKFLQLNDFYSNYIFHDWELMPLPLNHKSMQEWQEEFKNLNIRLLQKVNMGFPKSSYNLHQAATGIMCWQKKQT